MQTTNNEPTWNPVAALAGLIRMGAAIRATRLAQVIRRTRVRAVPSPTGETK